MSTDIRMYPLMYPEHFNPSPDSTGFDLYEHWETTGPDEYNLLAVAATPVAFGPLKPGDWFLRRRWAPVGEPTVYNRARLAESNEGEPR